MYAVEQQCYQLTSARVGYAFVQDGAPPQTANIAQPLWKTHMPGFWAVFATGPKIPSPARPGPMGSEPGPARSPLLANIPSPARPGPSKIAI